MQPSLACPSAAVINPPYPAVQDRERAAAAPLVHDLEKWKPVFGKDHASTRNLDLDPIRFNRIKV